MAAAGDLNRRVRFDMLVQENDEFGGTVSTWSEMFSRPAKIKPLQGSEPVLAQRLTGTQPVLIIVRYDSQTKTINPSWRAVEILNDEPVRYYALKTAEDMEQERKFITMMAVAGAADGGVAQ